MPDRSRACRVRARCTQIGRRAVDCTGWCAGRAACGGSAGPASAECGAGTVAVGARPPRLRARARRAGPRRGCGCWGVDASQSLPDQVHADAATASGRSACAGHDNGHRLAGGLRGCANLAAMRKPLPAPDDRGDAELFPPWRSARAREKVRARSPRRMPRAAARGPKPSTRDAAATRRRSSGAPRNCPARRPLPPLESRRPLNVGTMRRRLPGSAQAPRAAANTASLRRNSDLNGLTCARAKPNRCCASSCARATAACLGVGCFGARI